jgi:hypothetical protein
VTAPELSLTADLFAADSVGLPVEQIARYTYWPVTYYLGDATVISSAPLPLSGVKFSQIMKGVGELKGSLQLADPQVRAMNPWELVLPRKTGIVVVRSVMNTELGVEVHSVVWHGQVWAAPTSPETGRMEIVARTIEYAWSQRLITGPMAGVSAGGEPGGDMVWAQKDRTVIVQDLLTPQKFSQVGPPDNNGLALASVDAASADRVIINTTDAGQFTVGEYARVLKSDGTYREAADGTGTVFRITAVNPAGGVTAVLLTPQLAELSVTGDVLIAVSLFPGWITVDKPTKMTLRLHDHKYKRDQQTNLLEAHRDRSNVGDGYDWYTTTRVLDGEDAYTASTYRVQYVMGYPRLGRVYGVDDIPRFSYYVDGRGNALSPRTTYDGSGVTNVVWGQGAGYDAAALRAVATNSSDWANGFFMTEGRYSNPDVTLAGTLQDYTNAALVQSYANERFLSAITVRGDLPPYFGSYALGDDALYTTDDWGNPDRPDGSRDVTYLTRIMGWTVTPMEGDNSEQVQLVLASGTEGADIG